MSQPILKLENLRTYFHTDIGVVKAVDDLNVSVQPGQTLGIVGESGSGKSVTSLTVMRLLPGHIARVEEGSKVIFAGRDLTEISESEMRKIRGAEISMIFQEPMTSLNPVLSLRVQLTEPLIKHFGMSMADAEERALSLLRRVRIPSPESKMQQYPHHLSGGMRQRVMIAIALTCEPKILVADEPTTALDVTIQSQILDLIKELQAELNMAVVFITHDMAVIAEMADRVVVMYNGEVMEQDDVEQIFHNPQHDYTKKLISAVPRIGSMRGKDQPERFPLAGT